MTGTERSPGMQRSHWKELLRCKGGWCQQRERTDGGAPAKRKAAAQAARRGSESVLFHSIPCVGLGKRLVSGRVAGVSRKKGAVLAAPPAYSGRKVHFQPCRRAFREKGAFLAVPPRVFRKKGSFSAAPPAHSGRKGHFWPRRRASRAGRVKKEGREKFAAISPTNR